MMQLSIILYTQYMATSLTFDLNFWIASDLHSECVNATMNVLEKCLGSPACQCASLPTTDIQHICKQQNKDKYSTTQ